MKTILVPIDFSAVSKRVVAVAEELARGLGGRLVVLHVVQPPVLTDSDFGTQLTAEYAAEAAAAADKQLARLRQQLLKDDLVVEVQNTSGYPGQCILDAADEVGADFIVLGSHGHGAFYDLIVGSTASRVLKRARCPVLIVPPKPEAAPKKARARRR
jgi:nucleotide-binding universal stress UspA family protein